MTVSAEEFAERQARIKRYPTYWREILCTALACRPRWKDMPREDRPWPRDEWLDEQAIKARDEHMHSGDKNAVLAVLEKSIAEFEESHH